MSTEDTTEGGRITKLERDFRSLSDQLNAASTAAVVSSGVDIAALNGFIAYTPTIYVGTPITLGDGIINGSYTVINNVVFFNVFHQVGSTTFYPGGSMRFSLPVARALYAEVNSTVACLDVSTGFYYMRQTLRDSGDSSLSYIMDQNVNVVTGTVPFVWALGDYLEISGHYRIGG